MGWTRGLAGCAAAVAVAAAGSPGAAAQGIDQTCELSLTKFDPAVVNVAYPDQAATYYSGTYQAAPGTRIQITGVYPHARYMSFNVYDLIQRPLDALADVQVGPDAGSTNPFLVGGDRRATHRRYTAFVDFGPIPSHRAHNTLYGGTGQGGLPNYDGTFIYRVYVPDHGLDELGGVGVPTVTLETTSGGAPSASACNNFSRPSPAGVNETIAAQNGLPVAAPAPGTDPPTWRKFVNLPRSFAETILDNPYTDPARRSYESSALFDLGGSGGFLSNIHNAYLYAPIAKDNGEVLVTRMKAPTFPDTRPAPRRMPGGQLRYFSLCQNDSQSQRFIACRTDDETAKASGGYADYVVSTPGQRPGNATARCGFTWIPWGPQAGGVLIYRNMLPEPSFAQAIQRVPAQGQERRVMGSYFPVSRYYADRAAFEKLGCAEARRSNPVAGAVCRDRTGPRTGVDARPLRHADEQRRLRISGRAADFGCRGGARARSRGGRVAAVRVAVWRRAGKRCRFVVHGGRLGSPRACSRPVWLRAALHGRTAATAAWRVTVGPLGPGRYGLRAQARDAAGNLGRSARRRFSVR